MKKFILSILLSASFLAHSQDINFGDGEFIVETNIDAVSTQDGENFKISSSGDAGDYGKVYLSYTFTSILDTPGQGEFTGFAWTQNGEQFATATLQGVYRREGTVFKMYSLDMVSDGVSNIVSGEADFVAKTMTFKVSQLK